MTIGPENIKKISIAFLLALLALAAGRGLLRATPLAGHDAAAYAVNQAQFLENLRDGALFPRWSPDTRYGYGQPQLQFRPPLLHYLASPVQAATGNPFLALHLALFAGLFLAAWGAYALARLRVGAWPALAAAAGFVCANYLLSNLYLRGAYYEVMASAAMPWILWAQCRENAASRRAGLVGPLAWTALLMGHPATAFFFTPLAAAHALGEAFRARRGSIAGWSVFYLAAGVLLSAPYTWVLWSERSWVRLEIFLADLDCWRRHFFSLREWFTERWPAVYAEYRGFDYLGRARHPEMRGLNYWAMIALLLLPLVWWLALRNWRQDKSSLKSFTTDCTDNADIGEIRGNDRASADQYFWAIFFYAAAWFAVALALRVSLPVWSHAPVMDTFNYPWRVLSVTSLCLALAAAYGAALLGEAFRRRGWRLAGALPAVLLIAAPLAEALPHTGGWDGPAWLTRAELTPSAIRRHAGIPQQFYTPTWVRQCATAPATADAQVVEGAATARVAERRPTRWRLHVAAATPARIALAHYYYPGWRVHGPDGKVIEPEPWGESAVISFVVPPGTHALEARLGNTPARRAAGGGFILGLVLLVSGAWRSGRRRPMPAPDLEERENHEQHHSRT